MKNTAKKGIAIDFINNKILVTKAFEAKARIPYSEENKELMETIQMYQGFKVEIVSNPKPKKSSQKKFTYAQMEEFINAYYPADMGEFERVKNLVVLHGTKYQNTLKWFMARYEEDERLYSAKELKERAKVTVAKVSVNRPTANKANVETAVVH